MRRCAYLRDVLVERLGAVVHPLVVTPREVVGKRTGCDVVLGERADDVGALVDEGCARWQLGSLGLFLGPHLVEASRGDGDESEYAKKHLQEISGRQMDEMRRGQEGRREREKKVAFMVLVGAGSHSPLYKTGLRPYTAVYGPVLAALSDTVFPTIGASHGSEALSGLSRLLVGHA